MLIIKFLYIIKQYALSNFVSINLSKYKMRLNGLTCQESNILKNDFNSLTSAGNRKLLNFKIFVFLFILLIGRQSLCAKSWSGFYEYAKVLSNKNEITKTNLNRSYSNYAFSAQNSYQNIDFSVFENEEDDEQFSNKKSFSQTFLVSNFLGKHYEDFENSNKEYTCFNKYFTFKSSQRYKEFKVFRI